MRQDITKRLLPAILVSLVLVLASTVLPVAAADPRVLASWSASGPGIAIHGDEVYVTEWDQCRVRVFNATGGFLREWGTEGSGDGQFIRPFAIAAGPDGTVYVTDWVNNRVQAFNATGGFLAKWGGTGTENGQFNYPTGVAVDAAGNVYVADNGNHRVQKFNATGAFITQWGGEGAGDGQFGAPYGIAVDSAGTVSVADCDNSRVQTFTSRPLTVTPPTVSPIPSVPGGAGTPASTTTDTGACDDVNGDGGLDFNDVVLYFDQMDWIAANEPVASFDFNGNGAIDFDDVVCLFNRT